MPHSSTTPTRTSVSLNQLEYGSDLLPGLAVILTGIDGRISRWTAGAERLFGYAAAEAVGRPMDLVRAPEDAAAPSHIDPAAGVAPEEHAVTRWYQRADGT